MKTLTIVVTDETAKQIERLAMKGRVPRRAYGAYVLAHSTRPVKGERWVKVGDNDWWRLPERTSCGG